MFAPGVAGLLLAAELALPGDAPPPAPRRTGVVVGSQLGVLGFAGEFAKVAPPGPWLALDAGYEPFRWLHAFGYAELALTTTGRVHGPAKVRGVPLWGFGGGVRARARVAERIALVAQGTVGLAAADVPVNVLANLGFRDAEALRPVMGGRLGVEWEAADPHLALGLHGGARYWTGLARDTGGTTLGWEGAVALRYTF